MVPEYRTSMFGLPMALSCRLLEYLLLRQGSLTLTLVMPTTLQCQELLCLVRAWLVLPSTAPPLTSRRFVLKSIFILRIRTYSMRIWPIQMDPNAAAMQTRHARRIYVGGIPARVTEIEIANFFNDVVARALAPARLDGPPVVKVYLNLEKCYAFVEFTTIELCTACMQLDGLRFDHYTGPTTLRVRRPNDYRPELLPPSNAPIPQLNLSVLGITGSSSAAMGPNKLFVGGLPYNLTDEQVMELMGAFGPIKAFHQVRDPGSVTTKGYGFIAPDGGSKDVFVHISAVERSGLTGLKDNQKVTYDLQAGRDGRESAINIQLA